MPSLPKSARANVLAPKRKDFASEEVTYTRGEQSCTLQATPGMRALSLAPGGGNTRFRVMPSDFVFTAADLKFGDGPVTRPQPDDRITDAAGNVYRVMDLGGEQCWKPNDPDEVSIRVHTQRET